MAITKLTTENTAHDKAQMLEEKSNNFSDNGCCDSLPIILPWMTKYRIWWTFTVLAAIASAYLETYLIAFSETWTPAMWGAVFDYCLTLIFLLDIGINFNLAYYNARDKLVYKRRQIAQHYLRYWFWIDLLSVIPFYSIAMIITGKVGQENYSAQDPLTFLRLFKLLRLVRLHRVFTFFKLVRYSRRLSIVSLTLVRNCTVMCFWCHLWCCIMYFIARQYGYDIDDTMFGPGHDALTGFERYALSLYWSVVTFSTTGYGDWHPQSSVEQIFCVIYLLLNVVIMAWVIGSITLLIVKNDENTSTYHDTLQMLYKYATLHEFDEKLTKRLKVQLKLGFKNRDIADEQVLQFFPATVRRQILRRLYMPSLMSTMLMKGTRQQFIDSFLSLCTVEIFSPGEELLQQGSISSDLYLLLEGYVEACRDKEDGDFSLRDLSTFSDISDQTVSPVGSKTDRNTGDFLNDLGFFTESPEDETIRARSTCKVLVISRSHMKGVGADHPGSASVVLQNLLKKFGERRSGLFQMKMQEKISRLSWATDVKVSTTDKADQRDDVASIRKLIKLHINKQQDEHTNLFCFAASRGDVGTIESMMDQGFDPNSSDYDNVTALMVASRKGNVEVVKKLLEYGADPNLKDVHGNSALYEATKNNNDNVVEIVLKHGGELSLSRSLSASALCTAVYEGDIKCLERLLKANVEINATDYDKRTAAHIAASEGNLAALKLLVNAGADLSLKDRWGNTARCEAERVQNGSVLVFLDTLNQGIDYS